MLYKALIFPAVCFSYTSLQGFISLSTFWRKYFFNETCCKRTRIKLCHTKTFCWSFILTNGVPWHIKGTHLRYNLVLQIVNVYKQLFCVRSVSRHYHHTGVFLFVGNCLKCFINSWLISNAFKAADLQNILENQIFQNNSSNTYNSY